MSNRRIENKSGYKPDKQASWRVIRPIVEQLRMNTPGVLGGNWGWRFTQDQLTQDIRERLKNLTILYGRAEGTDIPAPTHS